MSPCMDRQKRVSSRAGLEAGTPTCTNVRDCLLPLHFVVIIGRQIRVGDSHLGSHPFLNYVELTRVDDMVHLLRMMNHCFLRTLDSGCGSWVFVKESSKEAEFLFVHERILKKLCKLRRIVSRSVLVLQT